MINCMILTERGVYGLNGQQMLNMPFQDKFITHGSSQYGNIALIVEGKEIWTKKDDGWIKELISDEKLTCLLWLDKDSLLVGMSGARLAWIEDNQLKFINSFDIIEERRLWNTPWGGPPSVRSLAKSADKSIIYANIHVGWIVKSIDKGTSWVCIRNGLEKDVHHVFSHPRNSDIVFAATARGFHISTDKGNNFEQRWRNISSKYQRTTNCFIDKEIYLASVAQGSWGGKAALYWSEDMGYTWAKVEGLPYSIEKNIDTFQLSTYSKGFALVAIENTTIYQSNDYGKTWKQLNADFPKINQILSL